MALVLDGTTGVVSANIADGTISASDLASGAVTSTKLATEVTPLGVGQYWSNVMGSRSKRTTYQNTTGRPIFVSVSFYCPFGSTLELWVHTASDVMSSGIAIVNADGGDYYSASAYTNHPANVQAIIPNGHYYQLWDPNNDVTIHLWTELS